MDERDTPPAPDGSSDPGAAWPPPTVGDSQPPQGFGPPQGPPQGVGPPQGFGPPQGPPTGAWGPGSETAPGWGAPVPPPKKSRRGRIILIVAASVFALLVVGGGVLAFLGRNDPSLAAVGDCMKISKVGTRAAATDELATGTQASQASCSDPLALYKIALKKSGTTGKCAGGDYTPFVQSGLGDDFTLCLGYNVATGDCFEESDTARKKIPCGTAPAEGRFKVVKKVDGVAAESACKGTGKDIFAGLFPLPTPSTLCIAAI